MHAGVGHFTLARHLGMRMLDSAQVMASHTAKVYLARALSLIQCAHCTPPEGRNWVV